MMKQLIVTALTKTFGQGDNIVHALSDVNLSVEKGEFLANLIKIDDNDFLVKDYLRQEEINENTLLLNIKLY